MKTLYESLLDDEDDLLKNDNILIDHIKNWISSNIRKRKGRVTVKKNGEISLKGIEADVIGPIPEYIKIASNSDIDEIVLAQFDDNDITNFFKNTSNLNIQRIKLYNYKGSNLSLLNNYIDNLGILSIVDPVGTKSNINNLCFDFNIGRLFINTYINPSTKINLTNVKYEIRWEKCNIKSLNNFPPMLDKIYLLFNDIKKFKFDGDIKSASWTIQQQPQNAIYKYDNQDIINNYLTKFLDMIQKSPKTGYFDFCYCKVSNHLSKADNIFKATVLKPLKHDNINPLIDYLDSNGCKSISIDKMRPGKMYFAVQNDESGGSRNDHLTNRSIVLIDGTSCDFDVFRVELFWGDNSKIMLRDFLRVDKFIDDWSTAFIPGEQNVSGEITKKKVAYGVNSIEWMDRIKASLRKMEENYRPCHFTVYEYNSIIKNTERLLRNQIR